MTETPAHQAAPAVEEHDKYFVYTDFGGFIRALESSSAKTLNLTTRGAIGRQLLMYFDGGRDQIGLQLRRSAEGLATDVMSVTLRPRDRRTRTVRVQLLKVDAETVAWQLEMTS